MDNFCLQTIQNRRTIYDFLPTPIEASVVETCLEAAIWAPNHKRTEPWRFWVCGQQTQAALADIYAQLRASKRQQPGTEAYENAFKKAQQKFKAIPQVIIVGQTLSEDPVQCKEDYAACCCAIQNFLLAAWSQQLGVQWSTGPIIQDERTFELLQASPQAIEFIGALYCGYPQTVCESKRQPISTVTHYLP